MAEYLTDADARDSLNDHVVSKGAAIRAKYGPEIGWSKLLRILRDESFVRYPCEIAFDSEKLEPGECAHPVPVSDQPEDGFVLYVHPCFASQPHAVPPIALYQLVLVNYGDFASADDAEMFGSCALGMSKDAYYDLLCELDDLCSECDYDRLLSPA